MRQRFVALTLLLISMLALSVGAISAQTNASGTPEPEATEAVEVEVTEEAATPSGDAGSSAIPLLLDGEQVNGVIPAGIGATLLTFDGTAGDVVTISVTQVTETFDPYVVLLGPRGEIVAQDDDSGNVSFSALIEDAELPTNGSYLLLVSDFLNIDSGNFAADQTSAREFEIRVSGNHAAVDDPDYSEDSLLLYRGEVEIGGLTEGFSDVSEPVYYYLLTATAGQTLDIIIDDSDFDTILMLFSQNGERVAFNDDDPETGGLESAIRGFEVPADDTYLLMVTSISFDNYDEDYTGGTFTLSVSE